MSGTIESTVEKVQGVSGKFVNYMRSKGVDHDAIARFVSSSDAVMQSAKSDGTIYSTPKDVPDSSPVAWVKKVPTVY